MDYYLWREYPTAPFQRYAATVRPASTPDGYEVTDHDGAVADSTFMASLREAMAKPTIAHVGLTDARGIIDKIAQVSPGDAGHFGAAIRSVPGAVLRGGRTI
jgi:hypothetical protein